MRQIVGVLAMASIAAVLIIAVSERAGPTALQSLGQPALMDEGSITMDPNAENPAAEFFRQNEESTQTDDDVPDAGAGNILPGWTHPELVQPPNPAELQSFESPDRRSSVYSQTDYERTPGALETVNNARGSVSALQERIAVAHAEAEQAKKVFEEENAKSQQLKREYLEEVRKAQEARLQRGGRAARQNWSYDRDTKKPLGMWAPHPLAPNGGGETDVYARGTRGSG